MKDKDFNGVKIIIVQDDIYKKPTPARGIFNRLIWFPLANHIPTKLGVWLFTKSCEHTNLIYINATNHKALELMYSYKGFSVNSNGIVDSLFTCFWEANVINAQAVRNRLKLVKKEIKQLILNKPNQPEIKILSLAAGSARAVIEVMAELNNPNIKARFVDMSRDALDYSKGLAKEYDIIDQINTVRANVLQVEKFTADWQPDIVEVVGLFDYLDDEAAIGLISRIKEQLAPGGSLIFSNINHNKEMRFVAEVVNWHQLYRHPHQLGELLVAAGFDSQHCRIICEPLGIQTVAIGTKA